MHTFLITVDTQREGVANELDEAQRLIAFLDENPGGPKIAVCYQNRYNVSSQALRRLLDSGELGAIYGAYSSIVWTRTPGYYTSKPWCGKQVNSGGGLLMNQAIHTLDLLQWFLGTATHIKGSVSTDKYADVIDVEDTAHAYISHQSGVHTRFYGTLTNSRHCHVEIELDCENALIKLSDGLEVNWADAVSNVSKNALKKLQVGATGVSATSFLSVTSTKNVRIQSHFGLVLMKQCPH